MMPVFITQPVKIIITDISTKMNVLENGVVIGIIAVGQTAVKQKAFPAVGMVMQLFIIQMQAALFYKNKKRTSFPVLFFLLINLLHLHSSSIVPAPLLPLPPPPKQGPAGSP